MSDEPIADDLLKKLGELEKTARREPRLEALAEGRLSAEDQAELERLADPEALAAFTPLDEAARERIVGRLLSEVIPKTSAPVPEGRVLPFRRPVARVLLVTLPLAAAAALAFFLLRPEPPPPGDPVPGYALQVQGGEKIMRSTEPVVGVPRLLPDSQLRLVLIPALAAQGPVAVRGWLRRDGRIEPWPLTPRIAPSGAALIEGTPTTLGLSGQPPGRVTLVLAIGRESALPPAQANAAALEAATLEEASPYRLLTTEVELLSPP